MKDFQEFQAQRGPVALPDDTSRSRSHRWGVILAEGNDRKLTSLTRAITGDDRPKQFSAIIGSETLLQQTQRRVSQLVKRWQTLLVLTRAHEQFYADKVVGVPAASLVVQPQNRGTTPAILYSLMRVQEMDPGAFVSFFPSDHHFLDDEAFAAQIDLAFALAEFHPDLIFLLGINPESSEGEHRWIELGAFLTNPWSHSVHLVSRLWENPSQATASMLMERGCIWNSFIMVGHVHVFLNLIWRTLPSLFQSFQAIRRALFSPSEERALEGLYSGLRLIKCFQDVLSEQTGNLAVLSSTGLGWSDLAEPDRVRSL